MTDDTRADALTALRLLDDPVRRRLYDWVVAQPEPVGREQAATATGVSRGLAAFHLDKLVDADILQASYRRLTGKVGPGAGRPARVYWRSAREFNVTLPERRYERAADLFASALERLGHGSPPRELTRTARDTGARLGRASTGGPSGSRLVRALKQGGYEPVTDTLGVVRLRNCPFDALVDAHRSLVCRTNLALAEGIARGARTRLEPVLDPRAGMCCVAFRPSGAKPEASATG